MQMGRDSDLDQNKCKLSTFTAPDTGQHTCPVDGRVTARYEYDKMKNEGL